MLLGRERGVHAALLDRQQQVLALARGLEAGDFLDEEILGGAAKARRQHRVAEGTRQRLAPARRGWLSRVAHAFSSRHHGLRGDAFAAPGEAQPFGRGGLDADLRRRSTPRSSARIARIAAACGPTFGRSQITVMSALPSRQPCSVDQQAAVTQELHGCRHPSSARRSAGSAGRCRPAPARRAARRTAHGSARRHRNARSMPRSNGMRTPPSITWSPSPKACTSKPLADAHSPPRQIQDKPRLRMNSASARSAGVVTLMLSSRAFDQQRPQAQALHRHRLVGDRRAVAHRRLQRAGQAAAPEQLRRQRAPQALRAARSCCCATASSARLSVSRTGAARIAPTGSAWPIASRRLRSTPRRQGRAASCTSTQLVVAHAWPAAPARPASTESARSAPPRQVKIGLPSISRQPGPERVVRRQRDHHAIHCRMRRARRAALCSISGCAGDLAGIAWACRRRSARRGRRRARRPRSSRRSPLSASASAGLRGGACGSTTR